MSNEWDTSFEIDRNACRAEVGSIPTRPKPLPVECDIDGMSAGTMRAMGVDFLHPAIPDCARYNADASNKLSKGVNKLSKGVRAYHVFQWDVKPPEVIEHTLEADVFVGSEGQCKRWGVEAVEGWYPPQYKVNGQDINTGDMLIRIGRPGSALSRVQVLQEQDL